MVAHLGKMLQPLREFDGLWEQSGFPAASGTARIVTVIERFLLGHRTNMKRQEPDRWSAACAPAIESLYHKAGVLGLRTVVLALPADRLEERIRSTRAYRNAAWSAFLDGFGRERAAIAHFERWQALMRELVEQWRPVVQPLLVDMGDVILPDDHADLAQRLCEATFR